MSRSTSDETPDDDARSGEAAGGAAGDDAARWGPGGSATAGTRPGSDGAAGPGKPADPDRADEDPGPASGESADEGTGTDAARTREPDDADAIADTGTPADDELPPPPRGREAPVVVKRRGGFLAFLAFLLAAAALAGVAWPYWLLYEGQDLVAQVDSPRLEALDARIAELDEALAEARREAERARSETRELEGTLADVRKAFVSLSAEVADDTPLDDRQWRLAEADYLLRVANLRARMEGDREGAEGLLRAADALIGELDDYGLYPVREAISASLASLRAAPAVDRVGLYLELESLGNRIDALPVDAREYEGARDAAAAPVDEDDRTAGVLARFTSLVDFRTNRPAPARPLLAPTEAGYLRHNLELKLEQAQLALLGGDQAVWEDVLAEARRWAVTWFDADDAEVVALTSALDRLLLEQVDVDTPDISTPLNELRRLRDRGLSAGPDSGR